MRIQCRNQPHRLFFGFFMYLLLIYDLHAISQIILNNPYGKGQNVTMYNKQADGEHYNQTFIQTQSTFNCSLSSLYTYSQSEAQLQKNLPYSISILNVDQNTSVSISSQFEVIDPVINNSKSLICQFNQYCQLIIRNGCPTDTNFFNYFDRIYFRVEGLELMVYDVLCDQNYQSNTFSWGQLILIFLSTILISLTAIYSKAWSIKGKGFTLNILMILIFNIVIVVGGIVAYFSIDVIKITLQVLSWLLGTFSVGFCANQLLYLLKFDFINKGITIKSIKFKVINGISFIIGIALCIIWWTTGKNWIVNDFIAICMIITLIKIVKITSMKIASIGMAVILIVQTGFIIVFQLVIGVSYNSIILNKLNTPFEVQLPTLNAVYARKCCWLSVSAIAYAGMLMAYMRRYDSSRNTNIYLIICIIMFLTGSVIWMFISIGSSYPWSFGLIANPCTIILIAIFSYRRKEIKTIWTGKFYDEEYAHKGDFNKNTELGEKSRKNSNITMRDSLFNDLKLPDEQSSMDYQLSFKGPI